MVVAVKMVNWIGGRGWSSVCQLVRVGLSSVCLVSRS